MEYHTILIKRKIIIIGFIGFIGFDLPTAGRDPCNSCNTMITFLGDDFLHMLKLMTLLPRTAQPGFAAPSKGMPTAEERGDRNPGAKSKIITP